MTPSAQKSPAASTGFPATASGDWKISEPYEFASISSPTIRATPKSRILIIGLPCSTLTMIFSGLRLRWVTPWKWQYSSASFRVLIMLHRLASLRCGIWLTKSQRSPPLRSSITRNRSSLLSYASIIPAMLGWSSWLTQLSTLVSTSNN